MKKNRWATGFAACLTAFTVFLTLDTFVLSNAYQTDATQMNTAMIREAEGVKEISAEADETSAKEDLAEADKTGVKEDPAEADETIAKENPSEADETGSESADAETSATKDRGKTHSTASSETKNGEHGEGGTENTENETGSEGGQKGEDGEKGTEKEPAGGEKRKPGAGGSGGHRKKPGSRSGESALHSGGEAPSVQREESRGETGSRSHAGTASAFNEEEAAQDAAAVTTDNAGTTNTYQDENVTIQYTTYTTNGTTVHVADVQLSSVESLKTAFAEDTYGKNVTQSTSDIAEAHDAILAVNGDYYGVQERGYVIRNGVIYRDKAGTSDVLCIYGDGSMKVMDPSTVTAQELVDQGVWQAFSFGPGLIENGEISVSLDSEVGRAKASNPRTAIGMIDALHYVFVVSDGRSDESEGLSLYELASFMQQLGAETAYNLDGGGSSTMVFQGEVVNDPSGGFGGFGDSERKVSDIVYIG